MSRRGRKKQYINKITTKDKDMLRAFRNCGLLLPKHLKEELTMADNRILNFQRDQYIEKVYMLNKQKKEMQPVFRLTEKGRDLIEHQLNLRHCYRSAGATHDLKLADQYFSLTDDERNSWQTESELRTDFLNRLENEGELASIHLLDDYKAGKISATDAAYTAENGEIIAVEIITRNYNSSEIEAKASFAQVMNMQLELTKI